MPENQASGRTWTIGICGCAIPKSGCQPVDLPSRCENCGGEIPALRSAATRETRGTPPTDEEIEELVEATEKEIGNCCGDVINLYADDLVGLLKSVRDRTLAAVSQPVAPQPPSVIHSNPCPKCGRTEIHKLCSELKTAAEPVAPGASALAQSCEIISDLVEKLDFEGITESESDSILRAKEFVRAAAPAGTQPAQEDWISVKERLPDEHEKVDVWLHVNPSPRSFGLEDSWREIEAWREGEKWFHRHEEMCAEYVTHWRTIPKPPTGASAGPAKEGA